MSTRSIAKIITARSQPEGAGATVRRSIGSMGMHRHDPFLMFDHMNSAGTSGFPQHPHRGQETITLVLRGAIAHEDFTGSKGILYAGDVQFMTAGKGMVHSEMPVLIGDKNSKDNVTEIMQLWVDLPNSEKLKKPSYRDLKEWEIPEVKSDNGKVIVKILSGKSHGVESQKDLATTPINYYYYKVKAGGEFKQELQKGFNYFLYLLKGNTLVLNGDTQVKQYQNVFFEEDGEYITGKNTAKEDTPENELEFVLVGGKSFKQEIVQYGPFVASSKNGIQQAIMDYQYQQNGFEHLKGWKTLISDGVTQEMIDGPLDGNLEQRAKQKEAFLKKQKEKQPQNSEVAKDEL
ncbi:PRN1 [Candida pseudojiufengensis]|uniref:PRN1 n=1 Tax=Candida pseudojiufengensis TaxID=497109 RepID=UPI0022243CAA|nr:PRN1 [Candida pseudojiufengensis]KAI5960380.1 PRN1 [Candida pseudojiufengensis]